MLIIAKRLRELSFGSLMKVYAQSSLEWGQKYHPQETPDRQIALGEQDFYDYLNRVFFRTPGAVYAVWAEQGSYVSALRLEPYRDGLLLEALETAPDQRRKGYAKALIQAVLKQAGEGRIYSHVSRRNTASLRTHEICGFVKYLDYAVDIDGSVDPKRVTMVFEK